MVITTVTSTAVLYLSNYWGIMPFTRLALMLRCVGYPPISATYGLPVSDPKSMYSKSAAISKTIVKKRRYTSSSWFGPEASSLGQLNTAFGHVKYTTAHCGLRSEVKLAFV